MADIDTNWTWNFAGPTTMSKAHSRANLPKEVAWDLIGFDGNETGCLRTHPGFKRLTGSGGTFTPVSGNANVIGFFPVSFLTSSTTYVWGYVWAEYVSSGAHVKFYGAFHNGTTWLTPGSINLLGLLHGYSSTTSTEVDVQVSGRNLMLFVRGEKPRLIQITLASTVWSGTITMDLGPGVAPVAVAMTGVPTTPGGSRNAGGNGVDMYVSAHSSGSGATYTAGNYSFAVQYLNTTSGLKSSISNIVTVVPTSSLMKIELTVLRLTSDYDRALIYRSVSLGTGSGSSAYGSGTLHLEKVITLDANVQSYSVATTDTQLPYQDMYVDKGKNDTYAPKGGLAGFMGNTLFVSRISDSVSNGGAPSGDGITPESPARSIGDMRWSNTSEIQPGNFSPSSRWVARTPGNEIVGLRQVGNYMISFSPDRIYRVGRAGAFIKVEEGHIGYGLLGKLALESVGTMVYFISGGGLKAVSMEGEVEDVTALDNLLNVTWVSTRTTIQLAFDARGQCLTVYQPDTRGGFADGRAAILWFGTNRVTELVDLPFWYARPGSVFTEGVMQRRTLFVKRDSSTTMGVYIVDHERSNTTPKNLCGDEGRIESPGTLTPSEFDCALYQHATGIRFTKAEFDEESGESQNQPWSVAPIFQQWVGGNVGMQSIPGQPEYKEFFRQKQISSVGAYFETVALPDQGSYSSIASATWIGVAYRGSDTEPYATGVPREAAGSFSVNPSTPGYANNAPLGTGRHGIMWPSLSVGWRCTTAGVDVRLLAFSATGKILDGERRYM